MNENEKQQQQNTSKTYSCNNSLELNIDFCSRTNPWKNFL